MRRYREAGGSWESAELRAVIGELEHFGVKLGLERMELLLKALGDRVRPVPSLLVAGTNGKGSVTATLAALCREHGLRTGAFTSPHLSRLSERFSVDGEHPGDADLLAGFEELLALRTDPGLAELTFFEAVTALARMRFVDEGCEAAVYEIGLGGRLDATRLCGDRVLVVTSIDLDHTKTLGETREAIAAEKLAALPQGGVLVCNLREPELQDLALQVAAERGARVLLRDRDFDGAGSTGSFGFWSGAGLGSVDWEGLALGMEGPHQVDNAVASLAAFLAFAQEQGSAHREGALIVDPAAVRRALRGVRVPGRLERVPGSPPILLDGAHNLAGALALSRALEEIPEEELPRPRVGLLGFSKGKDVAGVAPVLEACLDHVLLCSAGHHRSLSAAEVAEGWMLPGRWHHEDPFVALDRALDEARAGGGSLIVAGSLYLLGALRPLLVAPEGSEDGEDPERA